VILVLWAATNFEGVTAQALPSLDLLRGHVPDDEDLRRLEDAVEDVFRKRQVGALGCIRRQLSRPAAPIVIVVALYVVGTLVARRRGYNMGGNVIVRCHQGHLFTTIWVPGMSFKALRLGWARLQRCPVGHHWSLVTPVKEADLTDEERQTADEHRDVRIP